jgi:CRP-like cAMP-binding protein
LAPVDFDHAALAARYRQVVEELIRSGLRNRLLGSLGRTDFALLQPHLVPVRLRFRQRLQSPHRRVKAAYFPDSGIASVVAIATGSHSQIEVAVIGCEGMTGLPIVLDAGRSPCEIFVQVEGRGHCVPAHNLESAMESSPSLQNAFLKYAHVLDIQASYTALANARGTLEERLARWLLMAQDRIATQDELELTHEFLSLMLGVRRAGVTVALQHFELKGLVTTRRGFIVIRDRKGLEESAHGLYGAPEAEYERLFPMFGMID